jgi:hypothetical protein
MAEARPRFRCAPAAADRDDPMLGTAFPAGRVLLVEQPGGWGPAGLRSSHFDGEIAERLVRGLGREGVRVLVIRRPGRADVDRVDPAGAPLGRLWGFADCRPGRRELRWGHFERDEDLLEHPFWSSYNSAGADPGSVRVGPLPTPSYLVCAHGTHDVCCAIEGRPVAAALNELAPGRTWECSHLGGDRFAANVLVLPHGLVYGRVSPTDVPRLTAATERDEVLLSHLRGQVGLRPVVQAALAFAQRELGIPGVDEVEPLGFSASGAEPGRDGLVRLRLGARVWVVVIRAEQRPPEQLTCRAVRDQPSTTYHPLSIAPEAAENAG